MQRVPNIRIRERNTAPVNHQGDFILYWMIAYRRLKWNFSLQRAIEWARELDKPLVIFEGLRTDYQWASDRLHRFVIEGMQDNARFLENTNAFYFPYLEPEIGHGKGLLAALAEHAAVIVTDEYPAFMLPRMTEAAAKKMPVRLESVDSNGILPLQATNKEFTTAYSFRRFLQKTLRPHLDQLPIPNPLADIELPQLEKLPDSITQRWPTPDNDLFEAKTEALAQLPIDHEVQPVGYRGGTNTAEELMYRFLDERLKRYAAERNEPDEDVTSNLSPYLHFGHISSHQVFAELMRRENWEMNHLSPSANGKRSGWWGVSGAAEAFLDELITWREVGFNMCWLRPNDYDKYDSLPEWARQTLAEHSGDPREHVYSLAEFESASTHDELWNAAQMQLVREGRIHNYLRMLWGKKILHWTETPLDALDIMIELNNKYAVDGRDPNSYNGIFWVLGRYDRAWPEREIFGKVRYMTSNSTARKYDVKSYIERYAP